MRPNRFPGTGRSYLDRLAQLAVDFRRRPGAGLYPERHGARSRLCRAPVTAPAASALPLTCLTASSRSARRLTGGLPPLPPLRKGGSMRYSFVNLTQLPRHFLMPELIGEPRAARAAQAGA